MNAQQTIEKMKMMRLTAMAEMYHQSMSQNMYQELTTDEWMSMLIDHQWEDRQNKKINSLIHRSAMTQNVSVQDIDYTRSKTGQNTVRAYAFFAVYQQQRKHYHHRPGRYWQKFLAQAIGYQACHMLHKTILHPCPTV